MARYLLSADCYVCVADQYAVFLNLTNDKYCALAPPDARALLGTVEGWCAGAACAVPKDRQRSETQNCEKLVRNLLGERILTDDCQTGKAATPVVLTRAAASLAGAPRAVQRINAGHLANFVAAWLAATAMLRIFPLRLAVERVRRRKARQGSKTPPFDVDRAFQLMTAYSILRPNFFSSVNACLRDSLTVVEFLARYQVFPTWAFGVRVNPFAAHSWVQDGDVVLNDDVKNVNKFTPIMTI